MPDSQPITEIVVISGKGGSGKTSVTAALAHLAGEPVICDLDVDAPDLHILLQPKVQRTEEFVSGNEAVVDPEKCVNCGTCMEMCHYGAIVEQDGRHAVDPLRCEGCKVCVTFCPEQAIDFPARRCGQWYVSETRFGPMVHAQLFPGQENSGRLVTLLKQQARELAAAKNMNLILCDGAPGIGCPVISSLSGASLAVIVTEPTPSGRHDLERVAELCAHFRITPAVLINKHDLNLDEEARIETYCRDKGYPVAGKLPHDEEVTRAMVRRQAVTEAAAGEAKAPVVDTLRQAWECIESLAREKSKAKT